ncbi:conserved hypothetical protein [Desulfonatronospira thiodismutans ASO3-1]|uniref:DUF4160 domain-containing protein n=1 Tax=Desulfonatronospira thiodismutans ASO3-1 TaxID=555779 RepID=D6SN20_9BACT|nr:DUF4160 domain-containing protein [Desulfonatronospira thiodismutans]EFI36081.1 conserved hypothetical protein [Desulfonatronospira thiodismutans ASO3-1]
MPLIKRFANCQVRINLKDHAPPHFHVLMRDGKEALIELSGLEILQGNVPRRELSEVLQWAASNRNMLMNKFEELQK